MEGPLPVYFISVLASIRDEVIDVSWKTGFESNLSHFEIQRSANGQQFESIGQVTASNLPNGNSYVFTDQQPLPGKNYYRIKSVDLDATIKYSKTVLAFVIRLNEPVFTLQPNPAQGKVWIDLEGKIEGTVIVSVFDVSGKEIFTRNLGRQNTQHLIEPIGLHPLKKGVYLVKILIDEKQLVNRLLVQ